MYVILIIANEIQRTVNMSVYSKKIKDMSKKQKTKCIVQKTNLMLTKTDGFKKIKGEVGVNNIG